MIPGIWTKWNHELPPIDTVIEGAWTDSDIKAENPIKGKRCKRGCCFDADFGVDLIPPRWWRVPAPQEFSSHE
jgi:hypothetical protein